MITHSGYDRVLMGSSLRRGGVSKAIAATLLVILAFTTLIHLVVFTSMPPDNFKDPAKVPLHSYGLFIPILIGAWLIWRSPVVGQIFCRNYDTTATPRDAKGVSRCLRRAGRRIWLKRKLIGFNGGRTRTRTLDPDCEFPGHRPLPAPLVTQRVWMAMRRSAEIAGYSFMGSKVGLCPSSRSDVSFE
jgi:hypothetical protein